MLTRLLAHLKPNPTPGSRGESIAAKHLKAHGYRIIARNLRSRLGEIDLLAEAPDGKTIVLVEVKTREGTQGPPPEWRVGQTKQRKLAALAASVARQHKLTNRPWRFDIIGVDLLEPPAKPIVRHHEGAFQSPW